MYNSFQMINDTTHIMNEKNETYQKIFQFTKKFNPFLIGLILDTNNLNQVNFRGLGYEMNLDATTVTASSSSPDKSLQANDNFQLVFSYPNKQIDFDKHFKNIISLASTDSDLKIRYYFDLVY
jgi:hypothetical protein